MHKEPTVEVLGYLRVKQVSSWIFGELEQSVKDNHEIVSCAPLNGQLSACGNLMVMGVAVGVEGE